MNRAPLLRCLALAALQTLLVSAPVVGQEASSPKTTSATSSEAGHSDTFPGAYKPTPAILVDKKSHRLLVTQYVNGSFQTVKEFHVTVGKVRGDKENEGDLKTPEGIYHFSSFLLPPAIKPKFGAMAFYINYPNEFDRIAGHTGKDIMLHATDSPDRLKQNFDSEGCVVVDNDEISQIKPFIRLGMTPILIFPELSDQYLNPGKNQKLTGFFESWIRAWESKDIDTYIGKYHSGFTTDGKDLKAWRAYKSELARRYATIEVKPEDVRYYLHPKYSMVTFTQNYRSTLRGGSPGHLSRGTKILTIAEELGQMKIVAETFSPQMW